MFMFEASAIQDGFWIANPSRQAQLQHQKLHVKAGSCGMELCQKRALPNKKNLGVATLVIICITL